MAQAIKVRTSYTTVLPVLGLGGVLIMEQIVDGIVLWPPPHPRTRPHTRSPKQP